jgi:hypothetical protein
MARELDELFGGTGAPQPRTRLALGLMASGLGLTVFGLVCSAIPGLLLVLASWSVVETELDRVESGYLPLENERRLRSVRLVVLFAVLLSMLIVLVQGILLAIGVYDVLWGFVLERFLAPILQIQP